MMACPTCRPATPGPKALTWPLHSWPMTTPAVDKGSRPQKRAWSDPQIATYWVRTRTSPGPGWGTGRSWISIHCGSFRTAANKGAPTLLSPEAGSAGVFTSAGCHKGAAPTRNKSEGPPHAMYTPPFTLMTSPTM